MARSFGGGRSGGGRSFGGGGGRSFGGGGRSFGGSRSGRSFGGGSGRSFGGTPPAGRPATGGFFHRRIPRTRTVFVPIGRWGGSGGSGGSGGDGGGHSSFLGCVSALVGLVIFFFIVSFLLNSLGNSSSVIPSTVKREPLPEGSVVETGYFTDELGWISDSSALTAGMEQFYRETGVQPYLYLFDNFAGNYNPSDAQVEAFAYSVYDRLFEDEAHLLVLFWEYGNQHEAWYLAGTQARAVIDTEAGDILIDNIERYYYDRSLNEEIFFSKAFSDTAQRIMKVTTSPLTVIGISIAVVAVLVILFTWWKRAKEEKCREQERMKEILETPLESFGDLETEEIAKKYESSPPAADRSAEGGEAPKKPDAPSTHDTTQQNPGGESSPPSSR